MKKAALVHQKEHEGVVGTAVSKVVGEDFGRIVLGRHVLDPNFTSCDGISRISWVPEGIF